MARIFICYRRDDASGHAGRLSEPTTAAGTLSISATAISGMSSGRPRSGPHPPLFHQHTQTAPSRVQSWNVLEVVQPPNVQGTRARRESNPASRATWRGRGLAASLIAP
jgi:hypothetical protein